jgi:hypothetical protein
MSSAHGAGLMLLPVLLACNAARGHAAAPVHGLVTASLVPQVVPTAVFGFLAAAVGMHTLGLLCTAGAVAVVVYEKVGLGLRRQAWVNLDFVWSVALFVSGLVTLLL